MEDSIFTKIIKRELPSTIRYEDEEFIAFDDISRGAPVHVLVVPKKQIATLEEVSKEDEAFHARLLLTARKVAKMVGIEKNYQMLMNVGREVQMVHHIHVHLKGGWENPKP